MVWKWGFDGASGYSEYQQQRNDPDMQEGTIIAAQAVLIDVLTHPRSDECRLLHRNDRPGSLRHCRPIMLMHEKETKEVVKSIHNNIQAQMGQLVQTKITLPSGKVSFITHRPILSMMDGKVVSILTNTGPQTCHICGATPSLMNRIDYLLARPVNEGSLHYFISILHAWIRSLECMLHVAYRLTVMHAYSAYTKEQKDELAAQTQRVKENLKQGLSITVDKVKSGSYGNTNDGNLARRFFENPAKTASLTGLSENLLERLMVILVVLSCGYTVSVDTFQAYCVETAHEYVRLYSWYYMPCALHKILLHVGPIMHVAPVPIGLLSEESLESCHKKIKYIRKYHTRLCSRIAGNTDLIHGLLVSLDPKLSHLRPKPHRKCLQFSGNVMRFVREPPVSGACLLPCLSDDEDDDDDSD